MFKFSIGARSFNSINRRNRKRLGRAANIVARSAVQDAMQHGEQLESRRMLVNYTGTAGPDNFLVQVGGGNVTVTINGVPDIRTDAVVTTIVIDALGGNDTINVINNTNNPTTINAGDGDDSITLGGGDYDNNILSAVVITDGTGTLDQLTIDDTADALGSDTYTMNVDRTFQKGASVTTTWSIASMNSVVVNGSAQISTWDVNTDNASGAVTLNGGAAVDTFNVGGTLDLGNEIDTSLRINGGGGADVAILDDTAETIATTYTLDANGLGSTQIGGAIRISFASITNMTFNGAPGALADTYNILDLNGVTNATINAGDGNDTVNYGDGVADINTVDVNLSFNGQAGTDQINWNAQGAVLLGVFTATATQLDSTQTGVLNYSAAEAINVTGSNTLAETFNVTGTLSTTPITVNGGDGNDTFNVGGGDIDSNLGGRVSVSGGAGVDLLNYRDSLDGAGGDSITMFTNGLQKGLTLITHLWSSSGVNQTEDIFVDGSPSAEDMTSTGATAGSNITVSAGAGNDTMTLGNGSTLNALNGNFVFQGGADADTFVIDDSAANTVAQTYSTTGDITTLVTRTGITGTAGFTSNAETVTLLAGTGGASVLAQTFNINAVAGIATSTLTITPGDGNDIINIGSGDWLNNIDRDVVVNTASGGTDRINIDDSLSATAAQYTLSAGSLAQSFASGADIRWQVGVNVNVDLTGTTGANTFEVAGMNSLDNVSLRGGAGNDTLQSVGNAADDLDNTISGDLNFFGDADVDLVRWTDSELADGGENYTVTGTSLNKTAGTFGTFGYSSATETLNFTLDDDASAVTVGVIAATQSLTLNAGTGNDTVSNPGDTNSNWLGNVSLNGGGGTDSLSMSESLDTTASNWTLTSSTIAVDSFGPYGYSAFEAMSYDFSNDTVVGDNIVVTTMTIPTTLNCGDGNDTLTIGGGNVDNNIGLDLTGTLAIVGGAGTDSIRFDDSIDGAGGDDYVLTSGNLKKHLVIDRDIGYNTFEALEIVGSPEASNYNLTSNNIPATITGGLGADTFDFTPTGQDIDAITAAISIAGGAGNDTVNLNDQLDLGADTYSVTSTLITKPAAGAFTGLTYSDVSRININGNDLNNTFNVTSTVNGTNYSLGGGDGDDVFNAGGAGSGNTENIDGVVSVTGGLGTDTLNYNDQLNAGVSTYNIGNQAIGRTGVDSVVYLTTFEAVIYNTGSANNTINWNAQTQFVTVSPVLNAGAGNDSITVGAGDFDTNIDHSIVVNTGAGNDTLVFNDSTDNDTGDTYTVTSSSIIDSGAPANVLTYSANTSTDTVVMLLPGGNETVNVNSSISGTTSISGGDGNDTVNAGGGDLDLLNGVLNFDGGLGIDRFNLDNSADPAAFTNRIDIVALSPALGQLTNIDEVPNDVAQWSNATERVVVTDGVANTTFNVTSLPVPGSVSILGGLGNDTVNAGGGDIDLNLAAGANIPSFNGEGGVDVLNLDDSADNVGGDIMTVNATVISKAGQDVAYFNFEAVNITGSPQATTYNVIGMTATTPINITAGGANDLFTVGSDVDAVLLANLLVVGGGGADSLRINDTGDTADNDAYTFTDGGASDSMIKTGSAFVSFDVETAVLDANAGNNVILVNSMSINSLTLNGNSGDDNIQIADGGTSSNPIILTTGAGLDTVNIDSDADAVEAFARFAGTDEMARMVVGIGSTLQNGPGNSAMIVTNSMGIGGALDVAAGFFIGRIGVFTPAAYNTVLTNGRNGGSWNGTNQSFSSSAANASARSDGLGIRLATDPNLPGANIVTFGAQAVNPGDTCIAYVQNGDTDLDRDVDFDDLLRVAQNYNLAAPRAWTQGSFDYDNDVDFDDLLATAQNYGLPFLTVSSSRSEMASARQALAEASQSSRFGPSVSRALNSILKSEATSGTATFSNREILA